MFILNQHVKCFHNVIILGQVSPMPMISSPLSSRPALARCDHQALAERDEASITTPSERPPASELKLGQTQSLNLTEMAAMCVADDFNKEEVESDPSLVSVQGYKVKENLAKLLETIFVKYGDIAAQCSLSRMEWRSRFLEDVCRVFQSLEETDFARITPQEIKEKIEILEDIEKLNIQVGWLRKRLSDILEARQLLKQYLTLKESKDRNAELIDASEKELEEFELERVALETNMSLLKKKIDATKFKLVAAKSTTKEIKGTHSIAKTKVGQFYKQSLVDGLL